VAGISLALQFIDAVPDGMREMIEGFTPHDLSCDAIERFNSPT
jgi:hypothetical protein